MLTAGVENPGKFSTLSKMHPRPEFTTKPRRLMLGFVFKLE
jgi:hypothetical protein